jgi:hypothetical protein
MTREIKDGFTVRDRRFWVDDEERDAEAAAEEKAPAQAPAIDAETLRTALADLEGPRTGYAGTPRSSSSCSGRVSSSRCFRCSTTSNGRWMPPPAAGPR